MHPLSVGMSSRNFRQAYCETYRIPEKRYEKSVLFKILSVRARLVYPFIRILNPNAFHRERLLVRSVGKASTYDEIQYEVDFYQHKNVVKSFLRGTLRFRISGKYLLSVAKRILPG